MNERFPQLWGFYVKLIRSWKVSVTGRCPLYRTSAKERFHCMQFPAMSNLRWKHFTSSSSGRPKWKPGWIPIHLVRLPPVKFSSPKIRKTWRMKSSFLGGHLPYPVLAEGFWGAKTTSEYFRCRKFREQQFTSQARFPLRHFVCDLAKVSLGNIKPDFHSHLSPIADAIFLVEENISVEKLISTFSYS